VPDDGFNKGTGQFPKQKWTIFRKFFEFDIFEGLNFRDSNSEDYLFYWLSQRYVSYQVSSDVPTLPKKNRSFNFACSIDALGSPVQ